jgi:hypothetical protein
MRQVNLLIMFLLFLCFACSVTREINLCDKVSGYYYCKKTREGFTLYADSTCVFSVMNQWLYKGNYICTKNVILIQKRENVEDYLSSPRGYKERVFRIRNRNTLEEDGGEIFKRIKNL